VTTPRAGFPHPYRLLTQPEYQKIIDGVTPATINADIKPTVLRLLEGVDDAT